MKSPDFSLADRDYYNYLVSITGHGFWGWYVERSPNQQVSFVNKPEAVLRFVKYWIGWKQLNQKG